MQIERLTQMIFYIINYKHVTAKELANYFDVSTRTIYRDINTLTLVGIPIISTKGTGGGISLIDGYTIDKSLLSEEEQQNIYQGLQLLEATKYPNAKKALSKIGTIFKNALEPKWIEVDFTYWGSDEKEKVKFSDLQQAILNKQVIKFDYFNTDLKKSRKKVEPVRLMFKSHAWYLIGYCRERQEIRTFRLSRIKNVETTSELFERELSQDYLIVSESKAKPELITFKLKFSSEIAYKLYDDFPENQVIKNETGDYLVTAQYELNNWLFSYLLSFGEYVEIIEPKIARDMLKEKARKIVKKYE